MSVMKLIAIYSRVSDGINVCTFVTAALAGGNGRGGYMCKNVVIGKLKP